MRKLFILTACLGLVACDGVVDKVLTTCENATDALANQKQHRDECFREAFDRHNATLQEVAQKYRNMPRTEGTK